MPGPVGPTGKGIQPSEPSRTPAVPTKAGRLAEPNSYERPDCDEFRAWHRQVWRVGWCVVSITVSRMNRPHAHFTQISNDFLRALIPPAAFRVACYVLSHSDAFVLTQERIGEALGMARNTIAKAMRALEDLGYLIAVEVRDARGHREGSQLYVSDTGFSDDERAALCAKNEHGPQNPMRKNCAPPCAKIEQHKKTIFQEQQTRTPVLDVTPGRARKTEDPPEPETGSDTGGPPGPRPGRPYALTADEHDRQQRLRRRVAGIPGCRNCDEGGYDPGGKLCEHNPDQYARAARGLAKVASHLAAAQKARGRDGG